MAKVFEILKWIDGFAPFDTALEYDNTGLLAGGPDSDVTSAVLSLDADGVALTAARQSGAQLLITHHPVIFTPLRAVASGSVLFELIRSGIAVIGAHTNLDMAPGGTADVLAGLLGLSDIQPLYGEGSGLPQGKLGLLPAEASANPAEWAAGRLSSGAMRCYGADRKNVTALAVMPGAGSLDVLMPAVKLGARAVLTGELKHHEILALTEAGAAVLLAGHYESEYPVMPALAARLSAAFPEVRFTVSHNAALMPNSFR